MEKKKENNKTNNYFLGDEQRLSPKKKDHQLKLDTKKEIRIQI